MKKITCDCCENEIPEGKLYYEIDVWTKPVESYSSQHDFCESCFTIIDSVVRSATADIGNPVKVKQ